MPPNPNSINPNQSSTAPQTGTAFDGGRGVKLTVLSDEWPQLPSFEKGEAPTLLESREAQKVKMFIENFLYNFAGRMKTGSPGKAKLDLKFSPFGNFLDLWIPTDLIHDKSPELGGALNVSNFPIVSFGRDVNVMPSQNKALAVVG